MANLLNSQINGIHLGTNASNSLTSTAFGHCTNCGAGGYNVAIGWCSLTCTNSTGQKNTVIGANSGRGIISGTDNTFVGMCINNNANVSRNTILRLSGNDTIVMSDTNNNNTFLFTGPQGGDGLCITQANFCNNVFITAGDSQGCYSKSNANIFIGYPGVYQAACNYGKNIITISQEIDQNNRFQFGYNYGGDGSITIGGNTMIPYTNSVNIGGNSYGDNTVYWARSTCNCFAGVWSYGSDYRDKTDVNNTSDNLGLNLVRKLRPVSFRWDKRQKYVDKCNFEYGQKDGTLKESKKEYGFIAQEVKTALDELNVEFDGLVYNSTKDVYTMSMRPFVPVIVKALQQLDERVKTLKNQISNNN
jgi:hypothetical protein